MPGGIGRDFRRRIRTAGLPIASTAPMLKAILFYKRYLNQKKYSEQQLFTSTNRRRYGKDGIRARHLHSGKLAQCDLRRRAHKVWVANQAYTPEDDNPGDQDDDPRGTFEGDEEDED